MLFSTIVLPCHYTTHSTQTPVVQWWYKSYCTDRARDSFTFPESLGVSGSDLGATSHLNCPDKSRTVRIVASGRGSSMTLAEHYKGRDISIINKADLHIGRLQRGDSGVYFCKVVIADDLEGKNEGQVELLVQGVFSAETDEVKTVSVMEGDSVTLNPDLTQIQGINLILWRFGDTGFTIAQVEENEITYDPDVRFRGRLKLDHQTGSLTITNMRIKHSGLYKAEIIHNTGTTYRKFTVTVYESPAVIDAFKGEMKSVSVTEGDPATLQTDAETHGDELIVWRFGDEGKLIAKHDLEAKSPPLYDPDERFRDRLKLDHQTGSLTITNTRITDSGVYTVKISSSKQTLYKRFTVTVSDPALSPAAVAGIVVVVVVLLLVLSAAAGVFYYRRKVSELQNQTKKISKHLKQLPEISKQLEQLTKTSENELPKISKEELLKISGTLKEMSEISEQEMPKISEHLNQLRTEVTNQETTRSDLERGGEKRCITVHDTAISQATGDDKISIEEQGKRIPIRKNSREDAGVHTPDPTVVTPLLKK